MINKMIQYICEAEVPIIQETIEDKIIISMTSWPKRILNIEHIIDLVFANTKQPDKMIINLAIEEFPNKEIDLPKNLLDKIEYNNKIEIHWVKHNTKVWKKIIPTLLCYPNALIIGIDDDFEYPNNFIESLYNEYIKNNKQYPISGNHIVINGVKCHCGCCSLTKYEFLNNKKQMDILDQDIMNIGSDDIFYSFCAKVGNHEYKQSDKEFFETNMIPYNSNDMYSNGNIDCLKELQIIKAKWRDIKYRMKR